MRGRGSTEGGVVLPRPVVRLLRDFLYGGDILPIRRRICVSGGVSQGVYLPRRPRNGAIYVFAKAGSTTLAKGVQMWTLRPTGFSRGRGGPCLFGLGVGRQAFDIKGIAER